MTVANAALHGPRAIQIADEALCAAACREIYAQRPRWTARRFNGKPPFYTLGNAAYADLDFAKMPLDEYLAGAGSVWAWAGAAVTELFERVRAALEDCVAAPVTFARTVPEPGFHIFIGAAIPRTDCARRADDCASSHFDLQYRYVPWERWYANADVTSTISFTLPVKLPAAGGGLTIWEELWFERVREEIERGTFESHCRGARDAAPHRGVRGRHCGASLRPRAPSNRGCSQDRGRRRADNAARSRRLRRRSLAPLLVIMPRVPCAASGARATSRR